MFQDTNIGITEINLPGGSDIIPLTILPYGYHYLIRVLMILIAFINGNNMRNGGKIMMFRIGRNGLQQVIGKSAYTALSWWICSNQGYFHSFKIFW
jgi:hypothetical protein